MPIQGIQFTLNSQAEAHRSFQSTGSFVAYNPNDGVCLIALDRTATSISFDHKLPSQSGGKFPGPINSYLSIYYQDQSGSGVGGQIVVYPSPEQLDLPYFWSIGRAIQSQVTTLDIIEGTQPPNPASGVDRIWADSSGNLYHLHNDGSNRLLIDNSIALGGALTGTLPNPSLAAGVAASNIGTLGGALSGTLPNPGLNGWGIGPSTFYPYASNGADIGTASNLVRNMFAAGSLNLQASGGSYIYIQNNNPGAQVIQVQRTDNSSPWGIGSPDGFGTAGFVTGGTWSFYLDTNGTAHFPRVAPVELFYVGIHDGNDPGSPTAFTGSYLWSSGSNGLIYRRRTGQPSYALLDASTQGSTYCGFTAGQFTNSSSPVDIPGTFTSHLVRSNMAFMIMSASFWGDIANQPVYLFAQYQGTNYFIAHGVTGQAGTAGEVQICGLLPIVGQIGVNAAASFRWQSNGNNNIHLSSGVSAYGIWIDVLQA